MTSETRTCLHLRGLPSCFQGNELQNRINGRFRRGFEYVRARTELDEGREK